ncbi:CapA family protein [Echinicola sp. 20G]|uniref:CapA family protein n=1 Tax=Echinicola sp. 20G TaxID=2781961 RepID=UPI0019111E6E|nr:CapA family protein [Echinicola sp. 20G]
MSYIKLTFLGDVMLGRDISKRFLKNSDSIVEDNVVVHLKESDYVFANLEAPISTIPEDEGDLMNFVGTPTMLDKVSYIHGFSLANNHINDAGNVGVIDSIKHLEKKKVGHNGFYDQEYEPLVINNNGEKVAIICCTDILNVPMDEHFDKKLLWLENPIIDKKIKQYKDLGYFVALYAHGGIMFTRFPNPAFRKILHEKVDLGVDCIVTVHPHVLGGMEYYKGKPIFYSIGDFIMDGQSERRRKACVLDVTIKNSELLDWCIKPTFISKDLSTVFPNEKQQEKIINSWNSVSKLLKENSNEYEKFYKEQYKKEIILHSISTIHFQIKYKGVLSLIKLFFKRFKDFKNMARWAMKDTSSMRNNLEDKNML